MKNIEEIYKKRLQAVKETVQFEGHPESDVVKLLPPGAVTGKIYSYLPTGGGYFQIKPDEGGPFRYVKDDSSVKVVEESTKDESGIFDSLYSQIGSFYRNSTVWAGKNAGFVKTGFNETISDIGTGTDKYIRYALIGGGLYLAIQILKLIKE